MNINALNTAIAEAERFLDLAKELRDDPFDFTLIGSRLIGATRRASMDLSRALSDLRRPL